MSPRATRRPVRGAAWSGNGRPTGADLSVSISLSVSPPGSGSTRTHCCTCAPCCPSATVCWRSQRCGPVGRTWGPLSPRSTPRRTAWWWIRSASSAGTGGKSSRMVSRCVALPEGQLAVLMTDLLAVNKEASS